MATVILSFFVTESPLWLLNVGRIPEGQEAVRKVCKMNGTAYQCDDMIDELALVA